MQNDAGSVTVATAETAVVTAIPAATPVITSQQVGNATVRVGWTPPAHAGGETLAGYTLQYSTDRSNWTTLSYGTGDASAVLSNLTNGSSYYVRVRAETSQSGDWSPVAGPFVPVAPIAPIVRTVPVAPNSVLAPAPVVSPTMLLSQVMPLSLATKSITSLTGPSSVTITKDGRIELTPTQSVALINGKPVDAAVVVNNGTVQVQTESTTMALTFGSTSTTTPSTEANALATSTLVHGATIVLSGTGFGTDSPVITWIQSNPVKLSEAVATSDGMVNDQIVLPNVIAPGHHTIQVNALDAQGRVVSVIYGVDVAEQTADVVDTVYVFETGWYWFFSGVAMTLAVVFVVVVVRRNRRRVSQ